MVKNLQPGDPVAVGPYKLLGRLGQGGMGQVYLGRSVGGRRVAVKVIRPELTDEPGFRARFAREVASARGVSGIFTALVIDADTEGDLPWLATAYVPGPSLSEAVENGGPLPTRSLLGLAAGLAEGLQAIHAAGVTHRDLKPSNVLLAADGPRVIDFGISRAREATVLTETGMVVGSPGFLSPEQAEGRMVGPSTDVFSLGGVLTYAATGQGPFGTGTSSALLYRVVNREPELGGVPVELRAMIERCLAKNPAARPTPGRLLAELDQLGVDIGIVTPEWLPAYVTDAFHIPTAQSPAAAPAVSPAPDEPAPPDPPALPDPPAPQPPDHAVAGHLSTVGLAVRQPPGVGGVVGPVNGAPATRGGSVAPSPGARRSRRRRATVAAATALVLVAGIGIGVHFGLFGGGPSGRIAMTADHCTPSAAPAGTYPQVTVTGVFGRTPTVTIPPLKQTGSLCTGTVIQGTGATLTSAQSLLGNFVMYDWSRKTHKLIGSTYTTGTPTLFAGTLLPGLSKALIGQKIGSRVLAVMPPADAFGSTGNSKIGVGATDTVIFVVDMLKSVSDTAGVTGEQTDSGGGTLPAVTPPGAAGKGPAITIPDSAPPTSLQVRTLVKGTGPVVKKGQYIVVQYTGVNWRTKRIFDSSWSRGAPFGTQIGTGQVIKGWDDGLVGQTVGSRVLLVVPPDYGYGSTGSTTTGIKGTDTIVFVVDILAAEN